MLPLACCTLIYYVDGSSSDGLRVFGIDRGNEIRVFGLVDETGRELSVIALGTRSKVLSHRHCLRRLFFNRALFSLVAARVRRQSRREPSRRQ